MWTFDGPVAGSTAEVREPGYLLLNIRSRKLPGRKGRYIILSAVLMS